MAGYGALSLLAFCAFMAGYGALSLLAFCAFMAGYGALSLLAFCAFMAGYGALSLIMPRNRLPRVMKRYSPAGRRNHGRPLKRLLDT